MKKLLTAILSLSLLGAAASPALAAGQEPPMVIAPSAERIAPAPEEGPDAPGFTIKIDGEQTDVRACIMVPLRAVAEKLGFTVVWSNGTVTVTGPERYAELTIGVDQYFAAPTGEGVMGASLFSLGCAPVLMNSVTYVPVELFDALLGSQEGAVILEGGTVNISTDPAVMNPVQIPSPFTDHASLAEAAEAVGFELTVPEEVDGCPRRDIQTMNGEMVQVFYGDDGNQVCIRKGAGAGDISGDYNRYAQVKVENGITMKGENGLVHLAIWTAGGYTYSILTRAGMNADDMSALVLSVK